MWAIYTILTKQGKYKDKSIKLHMLGDSKFGNGYFKYSETCLERPPYILLVCLLKVIPVAISHLDELQKTEYGGIDNYVSPVINK